MFTKIYNSKIKIVYIIFIFIFFIILFRIFFIQTFDNTSLNEKSDNLWSRTLPIVSSRGNILDRNGNILASNITTTSVIVIPNQVFNKDEVSKVLSNILNVSYETVYNDINKNSSIERLHPYGRKLNSEVSNKIASYNFKGVYLVKESARYYPYGNLLSHVLGYVGIDNQGLSGLELKYDDYLAGIDGNIKYYADAKGNQLDIATAYSSGTPGMDISLTIDLEMQQSIERELDNIVSMFSPDHALALAVNPNTGEVYAMASRPNFDPNNYQNYDQSTISQNLPIWMTYEPGSTFKIITTSAVVEEGIINLESDTFYDSGSILVSGSKIRCWKSGGHGFQTYLQVFQNSCNPGFVSMGLKLGKEKLFSYLDLFGFGGKTGIDLSGESLGIIFDLDNVHDLELATTSFGQGVSVTPIQQVMAVSSIVNGGYLYKPYVLSSILDPETKSVILKNNSSLIRKTISSNTSNILKHAMETVVTNGGGKLVYIDGYRIGGKTGTAQKVSNGKYLDNNYIMSFMATLPSNDPNVVLYLAIDNPKNTALLSSYTTTPFVRKILLDFISILGIEKQSGQVEKDYEWYDKKYFEVPNVVGLTKNEASKLLYGFDITYVGDGNIVKEQSPDANERYYETGKIKLLMIDN